jgi:hypothetical protein
VGGYNPPFRLESQRSHRGGRRTPAGFTVGLDWLGRLRKNETNRRGWRELRRAFSCRSGTLSRWVWHCSDLEEAIPN